MRAATRQQIAAAYGVSVATLRRWCAGRGIDLPPRRLIPGNVVQAIAQAFGDLPHLKS